mgnify:FL=1
MTIKLFVIGKIKEQYLKLGINEYVSRITPYCKLEIIEVNDEPVKDNPSSAEIEIVKNKEADKILKLIKTSDYLISLDLNKKEMDSVEFAKFLDKKFEIGGSMISFVIGGSYGLGDKLKERCNDSISLSKMTFLHQMTRLILLEQIYRAFKINKNEVYHK